MDLLEKYLFTNELTIKRYRRFKRNKVAVVSVWLLAFLFFLSFTAEFWANSKPHMMSYHGKMYFPLVKDYHPTEFQRDDIFVMDYRELNMDEGDWAVWPVIQWDPYESNKTVDTYPSAPSRYNLFGTDDRGRDVMTRLLYGLRYTFIFALGVWLLTYSFGSLVGALMGYLGGKTDLFASRVIEVIESTPSFFVLITMIAIFEPSLPLLILLSVMFGWMTISSYMRGQFLQLRKREYVEAARALGSSHWRIVVKHILPNALTPIITLSPFAIAAEVLSLSTLDYLGLGLRAPTPSWGELLSQAQKYFTIAEWLVWYPSAILLLTLVLLINIGQAIRDAFDARSSVG